MKLFGIDFVPFNEPLRNRIDALAAGVWFLLFLGLLPFSTIVTTYLLFYSKYWPFVCVYLFWIWVVDYNVPEKGGRPNEWVRSWAFFRFIMNYFPITVKAVPNFSLDPERNYLAIIFPHGLLPIAVTIAFTTNASQDVRSSIPHHQILGATFRSNFLVPILREYLLAHGIVSVTRKSIDWILNHPTGGRVIGISVGGAAESYFCDEGQYHLVLKNRKGFAKLALRNGSPIFPIFAFGQTRNFKQIKFRKGCLIQRIRDFIKQGTGMALPITYGRGLLQYNFGFIPFQNPINIVIGKPIEVPKITEPTNEDINGLHQKCIEEITDLFEEYKYEYEKNPDQCSLIIS